MFAFVRCLRDALIAISALVIVAGLPASAQADVGDDLVKLGTEIKKLPAEQQLPKAVAGLRSMLNALQCESVECKLELFRQFSAALGAGKIVNNETLSKKQLADVVWSQFEELFLLGTLFSDDNAVAISGAFVKSMSKNAKFDHESDALRDLITEIFGREALAVSRRHVSELSKHLAGKAKDNANRDALATAAKTNPEIRKSVSALQEMLRTVAVPEGPRLNILDALYGDFRDIRKFRFHRVPFNSDTGTAHRICDATLEVRSACQGKKTCPYTTSNGASPPVLTSNPKIEGAALCGTDPVANASPGVAGLLVVYQCLTQTEAEWDQMENTLREAPGKKFEKVLRVGTSTSIRCSATIEN